MKNLTLLILLTQMLNSFAMVVTLPSQETLQQRFHQANLDPIIEKTNLIEKLAGKTIAISVIFQTVEDLLTSEIAREIGVSYAEAAKGRKVYEILLDGIPEALAEMNKQVKQKEDSFIKGFLALKYWDMPELFGQY